MCAFVVLGLVYSIPSQSVNHAVNPACTMADLWAFIGFIELPPRALPAITA